MSRAFDILHSPFGIETHKSEFVDYLEVCIDRDGVIHYAVPSHQQWLLKKFMDERHLHREREARDVIPLDVDIFDYLCDKTECIAVWNSFLRGRPNSRQCDMLRKLKSEGLYSSEISER